MRTFKSNANSSLYYALRDIVRRPRDTITITAITAAILVTLMLFLMWLEAEWRADVMPDHDENYHLSVYNLTSDEKKWIRSQDWVQATYDIPSKDGFSSGEFRIRVTWEHVKEYIGYAGILFDRFDLKNRSVYIKAYQDAYTEIYHNIIKKRGMFLSADKYSPEFRASNGARTRILTKFIRNAPFCYKTANNYMVWPDNLMTAALMAVFLGAAVFIITNERYRRNLTEYGTLRALGLTKRQIYGVNIFRGLIISALAILPAVIFSYIAVKLYWLCTSGIKSEETVYMTLLDHIPFYNIIATILCIVAVTVTVNVIICRRYSSYTVMDGIRGRETLEISYVEATSKRFESSTGAAAYSLLYAARTRRRIIINSIAVVIMVPLPVFYICELISRYRELQKLETVYYLFQAVLILIAAVAVIALAALYGIRGRRRELSVLRALGMTRAYIYKMISYTAAAETAISSIIAGMLSSAFIVIMEAAMRYNSNEHYLINTIVHGVTLIPLAALMIIPAEALGIYIGARMLFRDGISEGIREAD